MSNNIKNFYMKEILGKGSYGMVYSVIDENNEEYAIKQCKVGRDGIPSILEPSIMSSIIHPSINNAIDIYCSNNHIYILTLKAQSDLGKYVRTNRDTDMNILINWCYQITTAVACLHSQGIIHCDIKAGNVLLFEGNAKLTDFTLSVKKNKINQEFNHSVCTCTHRPLECLLSKPWDESLDIWSLGCTFFEIIYGKSLFTYQGELTKQEEDEHDEKTLKIRQKRRTANCIMDWDNEINGASHKLWDINFKKYSLPINNYGINKLILKMLNTDPKKRPAIIEIMNDKIFDVYRSDKYINFDIITPSSCSKSEICENDINEIKSFADSIEEEVDSQVIRKAFKIYKRAYSLQGIDNEVKFKTCLYIASKIIMGYIYNIKHVNAEILEAEKKISHYLSFRLHN